MHVRKTEITARVAVSETFVVEAQQVEHGCVQVVDGNRILHGLKTELIRRAVNAPALGSAAGEALLGLALFGIPRLA